MRKSRLPLAKQQALIHQFVAGTSIRGAATETDINKNTVAGYFNRLRTLITHKTHRPHFSVIDSSRGDSRIANMLAPIIGGKSIFGLIFKDKNAEVAFVSSSPGLVSLPSAKVQSMPAYITLLGTGGSKSCIALGENAVAGTVRLNHCDYHICPMKSERGEDTFCQLYQDHNKRYFGMPESNPYGFMKELEWRFNHPDIEERRESLLRWVAEEQG